MSCGLERSESSKTEDIKRVGSEKGIHYMSDITACQGNSLILVLYSVGFVDISFVSWESTNDSENCLMINPG